MKREAQLTIPADAAMVGSVNLYFAGSFDHRIQGLKRQI